MSFGILGPNFVQSTNSDYLCNVKTSKRDVIVPGGKQVKVQCRVNTGPISRTTPVLFEPEETMPWPSSPELGETLLTVKKGKTNFAEVVVNNPTNHDVIIKRRTVLGRLQMVRSVTAIPVKMKEQGGEEVSQLILVDVPSVSDETQLTETDIPDHIKSISLQGLTQEQKLVALKMLAQEAKTFQRMKMTLGAFQI